MRIFYLGKRSLKVAGIYALAAAVLLASAGIFLPAAGEEAQTALAEEGTGVVNSDGTLGSDGNMLQETGNAADGTSDGICASDGVAEPVADGEIGADGEQKDENEQGTEAKAAVPYRFGDPDGNKVSFAINVDWGEEYLPTMLKLFAAEDVHATFFVTGRWCELHPELVQEMAAAGHELGNHGFSHKSPNASTKEEIKDEIRRTEEAVLAAANVTTRLYAPPSGEEEAHVLEAAAECGYDTVLWSVDTIDWQKPAAATIVERVEKKVAGGAIILAHPTENTVAAFSVLLPQLKAEGYDIVTVSENLF